MDGEKTLGIGVMIWLAVFAVIAITSYINIYHFALVKIAVALFAGLMSYRFSTKKITHNFLTTAIWLGVAWVFIVILLDVSVTWHFMPQVVYSWGIWLGDIFILAAPVIHFKLDYNKKKKANPHYHPYNT